MGKPVLNFATVRKVADQLAYIERYSLVVWPGDWMSLFIQNYAKIPFGNNIL